ncbi:hypothetical protein [Mesobacillus zeae]|uniref:Uncharacterized protein n=1 Tax=Mesobacillus zeae TaxID=1917180 RepID=A0A398AXV0_9BACI|nr:hypothetical protein [Mesobacillus zeae]RID81568.1 hypothetical protein D1970_21350 [Mesobacillus zeae]
MFEGNLEEFQAKSSFTENAKKLAMQMGFKISNNVLASWEKHGQERVIVVLEQVKGKPRIKNHIGYITYLLNNNEKFKIKL